MGGEGITEIVGEGGLRGVIGGIGITQKGNGWII